MSGQREGVSLNVRERHKVDVEDEDLLPLLSISLFFFFSPTYSLRISKSILSDEQSAFTCEEFVQFTLQHGVCMREREGEERIKRESEN